MRKHDHKCAANHWLSNRSRFQWHSNVWYILMGYSLAQFGVGLFTPFLMVYFHNARHFPASMAGVVLSVGNVSGMALIPLSGIMIEKIRARLSTVCWITLSAIGSTCYIWARDPLMSLVVIVANTGSMAAWWNSFSVILAGYSGSRTDRCICYGLRSTKSRWWNWCVRGR